MEFFCTDQIFKKSVASLDAQPENNYSDCECTILESTQASVQERYCGCAAKALAWSSKQNKQEGSPLLICSKK